MNIFLDLVSYFGIDALSQAETFPELLQNIFYCLFAVYLIVFIFRLMFNATWKIRQDLTR
jgi:hypothetical protein